MLNKKLELLGDIEGYRELYFTRSLVEPGDLAFSMPLRREEAEMLKQGNLIIVRENGKRIAVIEEIKKRTLEKRSAWITSRGHEAKALLGRRIVPPKVGCEEVEIEGLSESVMKALVYSQCRAGAKE